MDELIPLKRQNLTELPKQIRVPSYDPSKLTAGIVHIGLGNFHRAHQAWYLHRLMDQGLAGDWAIVGAGVRAPDEAQRQRLMAQDWLTTLVELDPSGTSAEVIASMIDFVPVAEHNAPLIARMSDPDIRIVAMTVTEGGYYRDVSGHFDGGHPDMLHDAANPDTPRTAFGAIIAALRNRRDAGMGPFTGLSCDNLQGNGAILKETVISLARLSDPALADWIEAQCTFPNSMVDCIVPATGPREIAFAKSFGVADASPVCHENFRQWVIEDDFCAGRPDWDKVGATFSNDVHAYEAMKLRILNAGHQLLANAGELLSVDTIAECMAHPQISAFFRRVERSEIAPEVEAVPGMTADAYVSLVDRRFSNPSIIDTTRRVAFDGSSRHTGFLHPVLRERLAAGRPVDGLVLAEALWAKMCLGQREDGSDIAPNDPIWPRLNAAAQVAETGAPRAWVDQSGVYGDLARDEGFVAMFEEAFQRITDLGVIGAIDAYCRADQAAE